MNTPIVTYGGVILGGATLYDWEFTSGVSPTERVFTVSRTRAEALQPLLGKAAKLTIQGPRKTLEVEQLYLLEIQPGDNPFTLRLRLADRRWLWPKTWIATTLNLRRATGDKFLVGEGRIENRLLQPEIQYARFSLKDEAVAWTPSSALRFVIEDQLQTPLVFADQVQETEIQDLVLDDPGPAAVERLLAYITGTSLYVDEFGRVVIYDRFSGGERAVLDGIPPPQRDGPWVEIVDRRATRPAKVVVLFTPEAEMRLDHTEPSDGDGTRTRRTEDEPHLFQVAPVPDVTLEVNGETLARHSWAELEDLFTAWGAFGVFNRAITFEQLRKHALKYGWAAFEQAWGNNPLVPPDAVNLARAATAARFWRHTFRIDRFWTQRLASIRPYRAAIVNTETGAFAPASVYSDWTRRPSFKGFATSPEDQNTSHGWAVRGYADDLASAEPAPARVDVVDEAAGVLSVSPQMDPWGLSQSMLLGYPEGGVLPSQDLGAVNRNKQELYARWDRVVLEAGWRMAIVLTVVPGSPNDRRRFYSVEVPANAISPDPGPSEGPTVYARVFPGVTTARFAWSDAQAEGIKAAIKGTGPWPDDLLVNGEIVRDVAQAAARRIYETLRDRPLGGASFDMRPEIKPTGAISSVRHSMADGETTTSLTFLAVTQPADILRYVNQSTKKVLLRILNTPGSGG